MGHFRVLGIFFIVIIVANVVAWSALAQSQLDVLSVSFLDVGQGDAIFIQSPSGVQVLIDGGKSELVLQELSRVMPFYDKSIDMVIATHPDLDHIGGLPFVYDAYEVGTSVDTGVESDTGAYEGYKERRIRENSEYVIARRGQMFDLGEGALLYILFPDRNVSTVETNDGSIVAMLVFGETAFMFTGDASKKIEEYLVSLDGPALQSTVLKAGHHGSKTSSSGLFVRTVSPKSAVISASKSNSYGHPHKEVLDTFSTFDIEVFSTAETGTITFISDGTQVVTHGTIGE